MPKYKALVAGASGLVGYATMKHLLSQPDWEVVGVSRRIPMGLEEANVISLDLTDAEACRQAIGKMHDVTHLVYAALYEKPGLVTGWLDQDQMDTNQAMLRNLFEPLQSAAAGLQHVTLLQGTKAYGGHAGLPVRYPAKERWPRAEHPNFYFLQEDYLKERQRGQPWAWTIFRPQAIIGEAIGNNMNMIPALGVYGALLRERGEPLHFPGGNSMVTEAIDTEILAKAIAWAGTTEAARNETFNITNGDVFSMRSVWPAIAEALGMEVGEDRPVLLAEEMPKREAEWVRIVDKYGLRAPRSLKEFVGQSFIFADLYLGAFQPAGGGPVVVSTIKLRQAGFSDCIDTEDMFQKWLRRLQGNKMLPPAGR